MINDCDDYLLDAHYIENVALEMKKKIKFLGARLKTSIKHAEVCF